MLKDITYKVKSEVYEKFLELYKEKNPDASNMSVEDFECNIFHTSSTIKPLIEGDSQMNNLYRLVGFHSIRIMEESTMKKMFSLPPALVKDCVLTKLIKVNSYGEEIRLISLVVDDGKFDFIISRYSNLREYVDEEVSYALGETRVVRQVDVFSKPEELPDLLKTAYEYTFQKMLRLGERNY